MRQDESNLDPLFINAFLPSAVQSLITVAGEQLVGLSQDSCKDLSKKMKLLNHTNHVLIHALVFGRDC